MTIPTHQTKNGLWFPFTGTIDLHRSTRCLRAVTRHHEKGNEVSMRTRKWTVMVRSSVAVLCTFLLVPGDTSTFAFPQDSKQASAGAQSDKIPPDQLDSLVAPIA